jgi:hypothetical protein
MVMLSMVWVACISFSVALSMGVLCHRCAQRSSPRNNFVL